MIYRLGDLQPQFKGEQHFVADNATLIGDVILQNFSNVWFNAVLRGDNEPIVVGEQTNIQDGAVLHTDPGFPLTLGKGVTVGHQAMLHGCCVGDYSLIGIHAVVLNGAKIGKYCIIGANALVKEGMEIPDFSLVVGTPGKIIRTQDESICASLHASAEVYVKKLQRYNTDLSLVAGSNP